MSKKHLTSGELTELITGLNKLARNLWWTWNQEAQEIFHDLSPRSWQNLYHNAVAILHEVSEYELRVRLQDSEFAERVRQVIRQLAKHNPGARTLVMGCYATRDPEADARRAIRKVRVQPFAE